jgi:hypothetical protein
VTPNRAEMPIGGQQKSAYIASRKRDQAIVLQPSQSNRFVFCKYPGQELACVVPAATPGWGVERQQLINQHLHALAAGSGNAPQQFAGNYRRKANRAQAYFRNVCSQLTAPESKGM